MIMASTAIRAPTCLCSSSPSSTTVTRTTIFNNLSSSSTFQSKRLNLCGLFPPKGLGGHFSPWSGLKHLGLSISWRSLKLERKRCRDRVAYASLFGVGAPEALVIGVVALLVFGPKGLAEVARSLGKTLRAFQPTIKELQEVSREFKSTLEKEIGLDEISSSTPRAQNYNTSSTSTSSPVSKTEETKIAADPNGTSSTDGAYTSEELLKVTKEQLKASATKQQEQTSPQSEIPLEAQASPQDSGSFSSEASTAVEPNVAGSDVQQKQQTSSQASTAKENAG